MNDDVRVMNDGRLETDLFVKPTDSHQYLHFSSCHPKAWKEGIPFAQAMRLRRICSQQCDFEKRATDLITFLVNRGYKRKFVKGQVARARRITRSGVLRDKQRQRNKRVPFTVTYHPGLWNIGGILIDVHPVIQSSDRCKEAIADVPMIAFRRPKCLADYLVHARVKGGQREGGECGTHKCGSTRCEVCDYLDESSCFKRTDFAREYSINYNFNCNSSNVVYLLTCKICKLQYVGSTTTKFRTRFNNHKSRMRRHRNLDQAQRDQDDLLYRHFWSDGHNGLHDMKIQLIDRVNKIEDLRDKEGQWAYRLNTLSPYGLNTDDFFWVQNRRARR